MQMTLARLVMLIMNFSYLILLKFLFNYIHWKPCWEWGFFCNLSPQSFYFIMMTTGAPHAGNEAFDISALQNFLWFYQFFFFFIGGKVFASYRLTLFFYYIYRLISNNIQVLSDIRTTRRCGAVFLVRQSIRWCINRIQRRILVACIHILETIDAFVDWTL